MRTIAKSIDESRGAISRIQLIAFMLMAQGGYYILAALWPLISIQSFLFVMGPHTDLWLVNLNALLLILIGLSLFVSGLMKRFSAETSVLASGAPVILIVVEVTYSLAGTISPSYMIDGILEVLILFAWFNLWSRGFLLSSEDYLRTLRPVEN